MINPKDKNKMAQRWENLMKEHHDMQWGEAADLLGQGEVVPEPEPVDKPELEAAEVAFEAPIWEVEGHLNDPQIKRCNTKPVQRKPKGNKVKHLANISDRKWCKGDIGVEIEVEGDCLPTDIDRYWHYTHDGSLKNDCGLEYVLKKPQSLAYVRCALKYFDIKCRNKGTRLHDTIRAGVHIHINVQDLTRVELFNFIVLFLVWEEALVRYCGSNREGNLFCLRTRDAQYLLHGLIDTAANGGLMNFYEDDYRYAAMNVKAICEHGSLEFRSMRSTKNTRLIGDFAAMLLGLRELAKTYRDPRDIVNNFSGVMITDFATTCFGEYAAPLLTQHDLQETCKRGIRFAQDVAYAFKE